MNDTKNNGAKPPQIYQSRRPEKTVLYKVLQENLETWIEQTHENGGTIPTYIEKDFRQYLECGLLSYGFARARCECGHEFLVAFSCKRRGICPSCNTRHMAETAAHLVDHVFPKVPVRQWVLSLPKRLRYYLYHDPKIASKVLKIFLDEISKQLKQHIDSPPESKIKLGGVSFIHRFGASLNVHLHFHCVVIEGLFIANSDDHIRYQTINTITDKDIQEVQKRVRLRVLKGFKRWKLLKDYEVENMISWQGGGGFSVDGSVRLHKNDSKGLERLLRYCARPIFASEKLQQLSNNLLIYKPDKQWKSSNGQSYAQHPITLSPIEFIDKIATLVPPPRIHRHRYFGVLAPNSPYREQVTSHASQVLDDGSITTTDSLKETTTESNDSSSTKKSSSSHYLWAILIARIYAVFPLVCPDCGGQMRIIVFIREKPIIHEILNSISEPTKPPVLSPPRAPPLWEESLSDSSAELMLPDVLPEYEFDQRISW